MFFLLKKNLSEFLAVQKLTSNEQKVTSSEQKVTSNKQKVTSNEQKITNNEQQAKSLTPHILIKFSLPIDFRLSYIKYNWL